MTGRPSGRCAEPAVQRVSVVLCALCLAGDGGECHTPGCALWMNRAPDVPLRASVRACSCVSAADQEQVKEALWLAMQLNHDCQRHGGDLKDCPFSPCERYPAALALLGSQKEPDA